MSVTSYHASTPNLTPHLPGRKPGPPLEELIARPQWVVWRLERRHNAPIDAKPTKVPYSPDGRRRASSTDATTWGTYADALTTVHAGRADGVGFVFSAGDPYFGIDFDGCRNPDTGEIDPEVSEIIARFNTYTEPSPSGTGVHIIGRGVKPAPNSRKGTHIECYDRDRFFTMTLDPLPGYAQLRDCGETLTSWHREVWPQQAATPEKAAPITLTLEDRDIVDRLRREGNGMGKAAALLAGDHGAYPSPSEARAALAFKCCFYTDSVDQVARIVQASGLFRDGTTEQERERRARQDATSAIENYTGPRYDPHRSHLAAGRIVFGRRPVARQEPTGQEPQTIEELRAELEAVRAERDAIAAERDEYEQAFQAVTSIISVETLDSSTRLTAVGVLLLGLEFQGKGRKPTEHGHHMPASWIGRYSGQKPQTVNRQLKRLEDAGLIDRKVKNERVSTPVETINVDTGEVVKDSYDRNGKRNYIALPDNVVDIVPRLTSYQKPEDAPKRGGVRVRDCDKHPGAGLVKRTSYYCEACFHEAEHGRAPMPAPLMVSDPARATRAEAEAENESDASLIGDSPAASVVNGHIKLERDIDTDDRPRNGAFSWTSYSPPKDRKPDNQCIERGCTEVIPPGGKYYCAAHGGRGVGVAS